VSSVRVRNLEETVRDPESYEFWGGGSGEWRNASACGSVESSPPVVGFGYNPQLSIAYNLLLKTYVMLTSDASTVYLQVSDTPDIPGSFSVPIPIFEHLIDDGCYIYCPFLHDEFRSNDVFYFTVSFNGDQCDKYQTQFVKVTLR